MKNIQTIFSQWIQEYVNSLISVSPSVKWRSIRNVIGLSSFWLWIFKFLLGWMDGRWMDGWTNGQTDEWFLKVSLKSFRIKEYQEEYGDRERGQVTLIFFSYLNLNWEIGIFPSYVFCSPHSPPFLMAPPGRWQQQLPAKSSTQEIKGTKGMCWQDWHPCPLRGVNGFPAPPGSKSISFHSKSTANEEQILWLQPQLWEPRRQRKTPNSLDVNVCTVGPSPPHPYLSGATAASAT